MALRPPDVIIDWAFDAGVAEGDRNYWKNLPASSNEWDHFLKTIRPALVNEVFQNRGGQGDPNYWLGLGTDSGEFKDLFQAFTDFGITDQSPAPPPVGGIAPGAPGVMGGGQLTRVTRTGADDLWMMVYEWPQNSGRFVAWQFDSLEQVTATFGQDWHLSTNFATRPEDFLNTVQVLAPADEIIGVSGSFGRMMDDAMRQAAITAGVTDPTLLGQIVGDPEWQSIVAKAAIGGWTEAQIMAELRQTDLWMNTLYPGISTLYGRTSEPEVAWANYSRNVESALIALGYNRDPDGSFRSTIGRMLDKGIDDGMFLDAVPTFVRAEQSTNFRNSLNLWTQNRLGMDIDFATWFDVLSGQAPAEVQEVFELAQLQYVANVTMQGIDPDLIQRIAADTQLSEAEMFSAFNEAERNLLTLGDEALGRYGLTRNELISAAAGIIPESGRSLEQVRLTARKAAFELGVADEATTDLFVGFTERGVPERPGLQALSPVQG